MPDNPLIIPVLEILKRSDAAITEHQLMKSLEQDDRHFTELAESHNLALFQKHFLIMNALYQLQWQLLQDNILLHISPLAIYIQPCCMASGKNLPDINSDEHLRVYYTDWQNLQQASESSVNNLLDNFWRLYSKQENRLDAYHILDLPMQASWDEVQHRYRSLAAQHHPDRGGDAGKFIAIRQAYEILKPLHIES